MISTFTALFDANVFFGARLRSLVLYAAQSGLFRARWSEDIHREWMEAVVRRRPGLTLADLERTRRDMDEAAPDCLVTGYEALVDTLRLPDARDRHVLAAAIVGRADVIVTFNGKHFPAEVLDPYRIHVRHPDDFLLDFDGVDPGVLAEAARGDLSHYIRPPITLDTYLNTLRRAGVPRTADHLAACRAEIQSADEASVEGAGG